MNDLTKLSASSELRGKSTVTGFRFEREELAYFQKHVWNVWTPDQQRLAERLRTAIADLSMNPALEVDYEVDFTRGHSEVFTISCGSDRDVLKVMITDARFQGAKTYTRMQEMPPVLSAFELGNRGKKYGEHGEVDFETLSYKLRQVMLDFRYGMAYMASWLKKADQNGPEDYLQMIFRMYSDGVGPDDGTGSNFHIVLEAKNARVIDVAE